MEQNKGGAPDYDTFAALPQVLGPRIESLIKDLLEQHGLPMLGVTHRVKARESTLKKLQSNPDRYGSFADLHDFLGVRVVAYLASDVEKVVTILRSEFDIDEARSLDKHESLDPDRFGYLSYHLVGKINKVRSSLTEWAPFSDFYLEIQIRSVLQHAWAEIEHDLGYKSVSGIPAQLRRRFARLAGLLELADAEFDGISAAVEAHVAQVAEKIASGTSVAIDRDSLSALVDSNNVVSRADAAISERTGSALIPSIRREYADSRAAELLRVGFIDTDAVSAEVERNFDSIIAFAADWLTNPVDVSNLFDPSEVDERGVYKTLPAGISLYYLYLHRIVEQELLEQLEKIGGLSEPEVLTEFLRVHDGAFGN
jgi:putative GTP pyrophosphokinase